MGNKENKNYIKSLPRGQPMSEKEYLKSLTETREEYPKSGLTAWLEKTLKKIRGKN